MAAATKPQMSYIRTLLSEAGLTKKEFNQATAEFEEGLDKERAGRWIARLRVRRELRKARVRAVQLELELGLLPQPGFRSVRRRDRLSKGCR